MDPEVSDGEFEKELVPQEDGKPSEEAKELKGKEGEEEEEVEIESQKENRYCYTKVLPGLDINMNSDYVSCAR